jgi:hypothetical protein
MRRKGLPACCIKSQATIEKKEPAVKENKTVRLQLSKYREKTTKKRSTKRHRALTLLYILHTDTAVNEKAGFGHRNRLKLSKVARVDKKRKSERRQRTPSRLL